MVLVSGFAEYYVSAPPTHWPRLLRGFGARLPVRPQAPPTHWPRLLRGFGARLPVRPQGAPCSAALGQ